MLTNDEIECNKEEYIRLISSVKRDGFNCDGLIKKLLNSDFFTAPASTKYHCSYRGGLCEHCLNVYHNLLDLVSQKKGLDESCYDSDSIIVVSLLHDISKMNYYEQAVANKKVYCADGDKSDNLGRFSWVSELSWRERDHRFVYGSHEDTSEYIARQFIPLTLDESVAIMHHMGGKNWDSAQDNIPRVFSNYHLAVCLHLADMMATFIDEGQEG